VTTVEAPPLWPHQARGVEMAADTLREMFAEPPGSNSRSLLVAAPCGSGKTRLMAELARRADAKGKKVGIFTNRKILTSQSSDALTLADIYHGVLAAGHRADWERAVQVISIPTVASRVFDKKTWQLPVLDLVMIDEAHSNKADTGVRIITHYKELDVPIIGVSATPVGLGFSHEVRGRTVPLYDRLITIAQPSELLRHGSLVDVDIFAPDEPDMKGVQTSKSGEWVAKQATKRAMETLVFGSVLEEYLKLNPWKLPTLCWAPGVEASLGLVKKFNDAGVSAAHLDGETPDHERVRLREMSRSGEIKILCSCGVLREGADYPWICHGILIQPCGALSSFLQIVGRLLRAYPGKTRAVLQDHAGAAWRHGSPLLDREWVLEDTDRAIAKRLKQGRRNGEPQDITCPNCHGMRRSGPVCPHCGHQHVRSVRNVRTVEGKLVRVVGDPVKRRGGSDADRVWLSCLYAAASSGQTLEQAAHAFRRRTGNYLPAGLKNTPRRGDYAWKKLAADVYPWLTKKGKR
jgi:superfamily II DNA or RNA helicase